MNLFENTQDSFQFLDHIYGGSGRLVDYTLSKVNEASERQTGLRASDIVGKRAREGLPDLELYWIDVIERIQETGILERIENYNQSTDPW